MLKSTGLSNVLSHAMHEIHGSSMSAKGIHIALVTEAGDLIASSAPTSSDPTGGLVDKVSAIISSISNEYRAIERIEGDDYKSILSVTSVSISLCSVLIRMTDSTSISLVSSIRRDRESNVNEAIGLLRTLHNRIQADIIPPLQPLLRNCRHHDEHRTNFQV